MVLTPQDKCVFQLPRPLYNVRQGDGKSISSTLYAYYLKEKLFRSY